MAVLYSPGHDPSRVYYGTDTRVQSLLMGAVAVVLFRTARSAPLMRRTLGVLAVIGAGYTLWLWSTLSERSDLLYRGGFLLASLAVVLVIVSVTQPNRGLLGRALSWDPLRWIGMISYGLYLWHWPVYLSPYRPAPGSPRASSCSSSRPPSPRSRLPPRRTTWIEQPIRRGTFPIPRPALIAPTVAAALVRRAARCATVGARPSVAQQTVESLGKGPPPSLPTKLADSTAAPPTKVLLVGDSVAATMGLGLERSQQEAGLLFWNRGVAAAASPAAGRCWKVGRSSTRPAGATTGPTAGTRFLDEFQPRGSRCCSSGAWDVVDRRIDGRWLRLGTPEHDQYFLQAITDSGRVLGSRGARRW